MKVEWELNYYDGPLEFIASEPERFNDITLPRMWHCILDSQANDADWSYYCVSPKWDEAQEKWVAEERFITESDLDGYVALQKSTVEAPHVETPDKRIETNELNVTE